MASNPTKRTQDSDFENNMLRRILESKLDKVNDGEDCVVWNFIIGHILYSKLCSLHMTCITYFTK